MNGVSSLSRKAFLAAAAGLGFAVAAMGAGAQEYKIGLVSSLTGPGAFIGDPFHKAAKLAVDRANAAGGINGKKIQLIV